MVGRPFNELEALFGEVPFSLIVNGLSNCSTLCTLSSPTEMEFLRCEFIRDRKLAAEGTVLGEEESGEGGLETG